MDPNRVEQTVLVVADDPDILILAEAFLAAKGYRVLVADGEKSAVRLLGREGVVIHSVAIRSGMNGCGRIHKCALERYAKSWYFCGSVEEGTIHINGLEPAAVRSEFESIVTTGNAFVA